MDYHTNINVNMPVSMRQTLEKFALSEHLRLGTYVKQVLKNHIDLRTKEANDRIREDSKECS